MSNAFYFAAVLFWHSEELSNLSYSQVAPRQKYTRSWILGWTGKIDSDISLTPSPSPENFTRFSTQVESPSIRLVSKRNKLPQIYNKKLSNRRESAL